MDRWKAEKGRGREKRKTRRKKSRERVRRKQMQMREKVGKSRNTVFFQWFGAPEGRKVGSLKRRMRRASWPDERWKIARRCGAKHVCKSKCTKHTMLGPLLEVEMSKKCTPLWREAHFEVKVYKTHHARTTFGSWDVKKVHAVVARSTFPSQNVQNTPCSGHFWKLRCRKSARRCGAKHISKSKCAKHTMLGPLLEVAMSKKCTPLWREAHFQVKMCKAHHARTTFGSWDVEKVHAVVARSTFPSQNVQNTTCSCHFWRFRCRKSARRCGAKHISKSKCTKHTMLGPLLEVEMSKKCTPLWREAHFQVKMYKTQHARTTFGSCDVEKVHAVVARSTFPSQNVQNTPCSDHFWKLRCRKSARRCGANTFPSQNVQNTTCSCHFWKLRCRKSARRCGAKHISKSKFTNHTMLGPLLEVAMSKKCTPLWREAHFQVKMHKTHHARTTFGSWDVEKVHAVVARSTFPSQNVQNTTCSCHFWRFRCRKSARRCGAKRISKSKCTKHTMLGPLLEVEMSKKCTPCFAWQAQGIVHVFKSEQNVRVLWHFQTTMAGMGHLKRICKDAFSVAGAVQKTCSWEMLGGQGADFLRGVAFWRCAGLLRWFCVTGAALRMTWHQFSVAGAIL